MGLRKATEHCGARQSAFTVQEMRDCSSREQQITNVRQGAGDEGARLTSRHCASGERVAPRVRLDTSLLTARRSLARSACSSATAWNCTIACLLWMASWISFVQRRTISALLPSRCIALTSTALATTALLSTTACQGTLVSSPQILHSMARSVLCGLLDLCFAAQKVHHVARRHYVIVRPACQARYS